MIKKITFENLEKYFYSIDGDIYFCEPDKEDFEKLTGISKEEVILMMAKEYKFIFIERPAK